MSSAHSAIFPSLHLRHSSFFNPSFALPTSQLILQPFRCFTYVRAHSPILFFVSPTSQALHLCHLVSRPCLQDVYIFYMSSPHSPTLPLLHLRHSSFFNPSFASPTSQALHLCYLASRPCLQDVSIFYMDQPTEASQCSSIMIVVHSSPLASNISPLYDTSTSILIFPMVVF